jgi:hypothetical protein
MNRTHRVEVSVKRLLLLLLVVSIGFTLVFGCAATLYAPDAPPELRVEIRPEPPHPNAIWIDGHWRWYNRHYDWVPGYWERHPKGEWVPGRWEKRPKGWTWMKGHWRRR